MSKTPTPSAPLAASSLSGKWSLLPPHLSRLTISGVDQSAIDGEITWIPIAEDPIFWTLQLDGAVHKESGTVGSFGKPIIIDSGSTAISLPKAVLDPAVLKVKGAKADKRGGYVVPCDTTESIGLRFSGHDFWLRPRDWVGRNVGNNQCLAQVYYYENPADPLDDSNAIIGDVFFHSQYSAYRLEPAAVGFAPYKGDK